MLFTELEVAYQDVLCGVCQGSNCPVLVHTELGLVGRILRTWELFSLEAADQSGLDRPSEIALTNVVTGCTVCNRSLLQHALPVPVALVHVGGWRWWPVCLVRFIFILRFDSLSAAWCHTWCHRNWADVIGFSV